MSPRPGFVILALAAACAGDDLSSSSDELLGLGGSDVPNNQPQLFRMALGGAATPIRGSDVRGTRAAVIVHGFTVDVRAMPAVSNDLLGHRELYDDVLFFQYDTYHTAPSQSAELLRQALDTLPARVKRVDFYVWSLGMAVSRAAIELGGNRRIGDVACRIVSFGGLNYGMPAAVAATMVEYVSSFVPDLLLPPPIGLTEVASSLRDDPYDALRPQFWRALETPNLDVSRLRYYLLAGTSPQTIDLHSGPLPEPQTGLLEVEWQALEPSLETQSDGVLSIRNALGAGVLDGRRVARALVPTDHLRMVGLQSILGPPLPASGYHPVTGPLPPPVKAQLDAWLASFSGSDCLP